MLPMSNSIREKINMYIKNGKDISEIIKDVNIKGENLSRSIIKDLNRVNCDLRGTNFSFCLLGGGVRPFSIIQCDIGNSNFESAQFVGTTFIRSCKAHNCNFKNADISKVSYEHTDCGETSNFCGAIIKIGTREGLGAHLPSSMWQDLCQGWDINIKVEPKSKEGEI